MQNRIGKAARGGAALVILLALQACGESGQAQDTPTLGATQPDPVPVAWCREGKPPKAFGLIATYSMELASQKRGGKLDDAEFQMGMARLQQANLAIKDEPESACAQISELETEYGLTRPEFGEGAR